MQAQHSLAMCLGRAVQVEPIKPTLQAPASKSLKRKKYKLLSNVVFKCCFKMLL
jgi:hypothetical protein